MAELTAKQAAFVREYLIDLNATQAAIRAGYSEKTAAFIGAENLKKPQIQIAIQNAMQERERRTEITQDRVLCELAAIGFYDIADYAEVSGGGVMLKATRDIPAEKRAAIVGIKEGQAGVEVKMADKLRALELIGRHLNMYTDKVELTGGINILIDGIKSTEERDSLMG